MRPMLALAVLMLGLNSAAPEPEYPALPGDYFHISAGLGFASLVEAEPSIGKGDRLTVTALQPRVLRVEILKRGMINPSLTFASASADIGPETAASALLDGNPITDEDSSRATEASLDDLCRALLTSAQDNHLPIPFFANLLWQESRLKVDVVSPKGAMGIAQFMPEAALETGLEDPFDPLQAIPASARFLQKLRLQFGKLGLVAAAYNAGPHRVVEWLGHRRSLPRETRDYVVRVTGRSADTWRKTQFADNALTFVRHHPCRSFPAFAGHEQERVKQAQAEQSKLAQAGAHNGRQHNADKLQSRARQETRRAARSDRFGKHEAAQNPHAMREKDKSA